MKNLFALLFLLVLTLSAFSQDIIILKTGEEIRAKVIEVNPTQIKYKEFTNLEGPTLIIDRSAVFMIKYENGTRDVMKTQEPEEEKKRPVQKVPLGPEHVTLGGPRIGVTYVGPGSMRDKLEDKYDVDPFFSQFGWQIETRFFTLPNGFSGVFELVPLIGGLEQGKFLPSISGLIGVRTGGGIEFGIGPNLSLSGAALAIAGGFTLRSEYINFPINLALVASDGGLRYGLLLGFNYRMR